MSDIPEGLCQCGCGQVTKRSPVTERRYGYAAGQHRRFVNRHHVGIPPGATRRPSAVERFWSLCHQGRVLAMDRPARHRWVWSSDVHAARRQKAPRHRTSLLVGAAPRTDPGWIGGLSRLRSISPGGRRFLSSLCAPRSSLPRNARGKHGRLGCKGTIGSGDTKTRREADRGRCTSHALRVRPWRRHASGAR